MSPITRRLRSLLVALAVLALSATGALAGRSALSAPPSPVATQNQGDEQGDESEAPDADAPDEAEAPDADESETADSPDASDGDAADAAEHPDNHGLLVSEAAKGETPAGFDNHGAYVRTIAQDNHGHSDAAKPKKTKGH